MGGPVASAIHSTAQSPCTNHDPANLLKSGFRLAQIALMDLDATERQRVRVSVRTIPAISIPRTVAACRRYNRTPRPAIRISPRTLGASSPSPAPFHDLALLDGRGLDQGPRGEGGRGDGAGGTDLPHQGADRHPSMASYRLQAAHRCMLLGAILRRGSHRNERVTGRSWWEILARPHAYAAPSVAATIVHLGENPPPRTEGRDRAVPRSPPIGSPRGGRPHLPPMPCGRAKRVINGLPIVLPGPRGRAH